jgi:hypothetical protein
VGGAGILSATRAAWAAIESAPIVEVVTAVATHERTSALISFVWGGY